MMVSIPQENLTFMRQCIAVLSVLTIYFFLMKLVAEEKHKELLAKYNKLLEYAKTVEGRYNNLLYENKYKLKP
jgi:hypothetical protein